MKTKTRLPSPDIHVVTQCVKALNKSTSRRMLRANLIYLWDRFIAHPSPELPQHLSNEPPSVKGIEGTTNQHEK
jgi:hypothetical protein